MGSVLRIPGFTSLPQGVTTYNTLGISGSFSHPLVGVFIIAGGNIGRGRITVRMTREHVEHQVSCDGSILTTIIPGNDGELEIEMQQTSPLHQFLIRWFNAVQGAIHPRVGVTVQPGNLVIAAAASCLLRNAATAEQITLTGIAPSRVPDIPYAAQGSNVTWRLIAANVSYQ